MGECVELSADGAFCKLNLSQQIKTIDLVALVESAGVELEQRGNKHIGLCAVHSETNPSFTIFDGRRFHCFGCGARGDAADFIQQVYGCDFPEALRRLGIDGRLTPEQQKKIESKKKIASERKQRERDIIYTLSILIRAANKCSEFIDLLPCWEWYHQTICTGTKEEKQEVIKGLENWPTISRTHLFKPTFNYRRWLNNFLDRGGSETGEENATISTKKTNNLRPVS